MNTQPLVAFLRRQLDKRKIVCVVRTKELDNYAFNSSYTILAYQLLASDDVRGKAYRNVINKVVRGRKVVDVGTGGLAYMARMCREAGASIVHAIEYNEKFRDSIEASIATTRSEDCPIKVYYGFSTDINLPESCDVLLQQVIGTISSNEGVARTVKDAKRFLNPGAVFIPAACGTYVCPTSPLERKWSHKIVNLLVGGTNTIEPLRMHEVLHFPTSNLMAEPGEMEMFVFSEDYPLVFDRKLEFRMDRDGLVDGLVFYMQIVVDRDNVVSSRGENVAWPNPYLKLFDTPVRVAKGDVMSVDIHVDLATIQPSYGVEVSLSSTPEGRTCRAAHRWAGAGK
ncbi:hypothetical protein [Hyalangium versicolor]|uniref:hypothetical protein n=1 Tax=Hyalangium versicolor TaxID=2861190 RepID=UPI001CCF0694|nr:hypothetical protein [Hyalangium versicolor]